MKLFGYVNIIVGIAYSIMAAPIALMLFFVLIPFALVIGAVREVKELATTYPSDVVRMLQHGFKVSNNGLKRIRGER